MAAGIHALAQILAGLEMRDVFAGKRNRFAGLRVAADARWPEMQRETPETSDLDPLALGQRVAHQVQQVLDSQFHVLRGKMFLLAGDNFY